MDLSSLRVKELTEICKRLGALCAVCCLPLAANSEE